jgi:hypothetical protein
LSPILRLCAYPTLESVAKDARRRDKTLVDLTQLANFAKTSVRADAVVLTPPNFGAFRVFAERAIVVDFKAWAFGNPTVWRERLTGVYGDFGDARGFELMAYLDEAYREIDDGGMARIAER